MDSGEWRLGEAADGTPWTDRPAAPEPAPDLWDDDSPDTWAVTQPWHPRRQADPTRAGDRPGTPPDAPASGYGTGGYPAVSYEPAPGPAPYGHTAYGPASYGQGGYAPAPVSVPYEQPVYGQSRYADEPAPSGYASTGLDQRSRPDLGPRHRSAPEHPSGAIPQPPPPPPPPPPRFGRVLGLTAAWYAIPTVAYLIWLVALSGDRPGSTGTRQVTATLPWLLAAIVVSMGLCLALRRVTVGWRSLGISFAAAVIGAGLATIIHSFST